MPLFIILALIVIIVATVLISLSTSKPTSRKGTSASRQRPATSPDDEITSERTYVYQRQPALFTPAEVLFYQGLQAAIGEQFLIFGKVRVADIINPQSTPDRSEWQRAFNKISSKHFDFVLCNPETLEVVAVIELDDRSHTQKKRIQRDNFLNQVSESVGLTMIRFTARSSYEPESLQAQILKALK